MFCFLDTYCVLYYSCCGSTEGKSSAPATETDGTPSAPDTRSGFSPAPAGTMDPPPITSPDRTPLDAPTPVGGLPQTAAQPAGHDISAPVPVPTAASKGPKAVRGWAPPAKEWDKQEATKGDKTRFEIKEEWDEDGNLVRTTIKKTITPDWKWKTEKTVEVIPAAEAAKQKK
jgi:hypothetical protein